MIMEKKVLVLDSDEKQCRQFCDILETGQYPAVPVQSLSATQRCLEENDFIIAIIDIDTVSVTNQIIREMTIKHPNIYFLCLSERPFHPELEDAICYHIYACINKPVDSDELFYFLRSIYEEDTGT